MPRQKQLKWDGAEAKARAKRIVHLHDVDKLGFTVIGQRLGLHASQVKRIYSNYWRSK